MNKLLHALGIHWSPHDFIPSLWVWRFLITLQRFPENALNVAFYDAPAGENLRWSFDLRWPIARRR